MKTNTLNTKVGRKAKQAIVMFFAIFIGILVSFGTAEAKDNHRVNKRNVAEMRRHNKRYAHACTLLPLKWNARVKTKEKSAKWR